VLCLFNYSPEEVRDKGVPHTGKVIRTYESAHAIGSDGTRRHADNVIAQLTNGDEETISVNSIEYFTVGEEVPLWEYEGVWYIDKYGNMERPSPLHGVVVFVLSLITIVYWKVFRR
jgi:hypothetical protein